VTGCGRSGTLFVAHFLNSLGWEISHDNDRELCPCPGNDGAVSHPLAFAGLERKQKCDVIRWSPAPTRMFRRLGHLVHNPLSYVNSRSSTVWDFEECNMQQPDEKLGSKMRGKNEEKAVKAL
jgi:hypothetical protein